MGTSDRLVDLEQLEPRRATFVPDWQDATEARRGLGKAWIGESHFSVTMDLVEALQEEQEVQLEDQCGGFSAQCPRALVTPTAPTEHERELHSLTHLPLQVMVPQG